MWFDPHAALTELEAAPVANSANSAKPAPDTGRQFAEFAGFAAPPRPKPELTPPPRVEGPTPEPDSYPHGTACDMGLFPRTWTGRVVTLAEWRDLTDWERHGPNGRQWNEATGRWEDAGV